MKTTTQLIEQVVREHQENMTYLAETKAAVAEIMEHTTKTFEKLNQQMAAFQTSVMQDYEMLEKRIADQAARLGVLDMEQPEPPEGNVVAFEDRG